MYYIDIKDALYFMVNVCSWQNGLFYRQQIAYNPFIIHVFLFDKSNKILYIMTDNLLGITETSPYSFGNFRKLSLYKCFMPI